jgi:hypothetical protein
MTGLAQVDGLRGGAHDDASLAARFARDWDYVRGWSFGLDLRILFSTLIMVLTNRLAERASESCAEDGASASAPINDGDERDEDDRVRVARG